MTPDLAQATVTAFAAQRTATALGTATAQAAASATAQAAEFRRQAEEAAATATAQARPTSTPTVTPKPAPSPTGTPVPLPTPTTGPRYTAATGGSGEVQVTGGSASFGFGLGKRPDGKLEGWLIYGSGRGTLRATEFTTLEIQQSSAGFWGFGFLSEQTERVSFNVTARMGAQGGSGGNLRVVVFRPDGKELLNEGGPVVRGSVTVTKP